MSNPLPTWTYLRQENNYTGHRFFRNSTGDVAITDYSQKVHDRPEITLDGLLLVDLSRPIKQDPNTGISLIPIVDAKGTPFVTPSSEGDVDFCVKNLGFAPLPTPKKRW